MTIHESRLLRDYVRQHGRDTSDKRYLRPVPFWLRRRHHPLDWLTVAVYAVGLALILRWIP